MEGLGSAARTAPPLVFDFVLQRRACILSEQAVTRPSETRSLIGIGFFVLPRKLCPDKQASLSRPNEGSAHRLEPSSNRCGRALAANGRTARTGVDSNFRAPARPSVAAAASDERAVESRSLKTRGTFIQIRLAIPALPNVIWTSMLQATCGYFWDAYRKKWPDVDSCIWQFLATLHASKRRWFHVTPNV